MDKYLTLDQLTALCIKYGYELAFIRAIISVESSGIGFSRMAPYRMIVRFEPSWFKKEYALWKSKSTTWMNTGIQDQNAEWKSFNAAFAEDPHAAMLSSSCGIMQVMGINFTDCSFKSIDDFWTFNNISEINQVEVALRFCKSNHYIDQAIKTNNPTLFAEHYNGPDFKELAAQTHSLPYDVRIFAARNKFLALQAAGK